MPRESPGTNQKSIASHEFDDKAVKLLENRPLTDSPENVFSLGSVPRMSPAPRDEWAVKIGPWKKLESLMCGIAGIVHFHETLQPETIRRMTDALRHRGPDDEGFLAADLEKGRGVPLLGPESPLKGPKIETFREPVNALLGHRRLSIIDLSASGHGPMSNEDGSVWITYNGEIYNYQDLRSELQGLGHRFQSRTDTEVVLHAYEAWGVSCLSRFNGMWSFALLDLKAKRLFCARDRAGVKPFYYRYDGRSFCFASEIKALLTANGFQAVPNEQVMADYLLVRSPGSYARDLFQRDLPIEAGTLPGG